MDLPQNVPKHRVEQMDIGMEYEILMLQVGVLTRKRAAAEETLAKHQAELDAVIEKLEIHNNHLVKLQKESFSNTMLKVLGTFDHVYDRESEDILRAKLEFDKAYALRLAAHRALIELEVTISEKKHRLRSVRENLLRKNPLLENTVSEEEQELIHLQYEFVQTIEAEVAAYQLLEVISDILEKVDAAKTITRWELITEIETLLDFVDQDQLDIAEAMMLNLERKIQNLERELHDLNYIYINQYREIIAARPAIEDFFEKLFSEWSTKEVIEKNLEHLTALRDNVVEVMGIVTAQKHVLEGIYLKKIQ